MDLPKGHTTLQALELPEPEPTPNKKKSRNKKNKSTIQGKKNLTFLNRASRSDFFGWSYGRFSLLVLIVYVLECF